MYTDFLSTEYVTELPKDALNELSSAVNGVTASTLFITKTVSVKYIPVPREEARPPRRRITFTPETVHWSPTVTEVPESEVKTHFNNALLSLVGIVVFAWILVSGFLLRKKIHELRQKRRAREPPSFSDTQFSNNSTLTLNFSNTDVNSSFQLHDMPEFGVVDIASSSNDSPSFVSYQVSVQNQISTENSVSEEPPSYTQIQERNLHMLETSGKEQLPSYEEALLQMSMQKNGS